MRRGLPVVSVVVIGVLSAGISLGCAVAPAEQEAIRRAWAERDAERARECHQAGAGFAAGGCVRGGP